MSGGNNYRLIWFQHFHKAAGSSIVNMAIQNGETLYPNHVNANPIGDDGEPLQLWKYSAEELKRFVDSCEKHNITFVATEWGLPDITVLGNDSRVRLITCIRHPLGRFVSNFYFDLHYGFTPARTLRDYVATRNRTITMFNYYCRILSRHNNNPTDITETEYREAIKNLDAFYSVVVLEHGFSPLRSQLGWTIDNKQSNKNKLNSRTMLSLIKRGKFDLLYFRLFRKKKRPDSEFQEHFTTYNPWDLKLYDYCKTRYVEEQSRY